MRNSTLLAAIAVLVPAARSFALPCHQPGKPDVKLWQKPGSMDQIWPGHPSNPDPNTWTFAQQSFFYDQLYVTDVNDAARVWGHQAIGAFTEAQRSKVRCVPSTNEYQMLCAFDCITADGVVSDPELHSAACGITIIAREDSDAVCDLDPNRDRVPYWGLYGSPVGGHIPGADFTDTQKGKIKAENAKMNHCGAGVSCIYRSDARRISSAGSAIEPWPDLGIKPYGDNSPEVDHLIPRVDKYGCGCGTNAPSNALLISRELNNSMSNNYVTNAAREALLTFYTSPAAVPRQLPSPDEGADDSADADLGGCSAGGSSTAGAGILALLVGVVLPRRRRASSLR